MLSLTAGASSTASPGEGQHSEAAGEAIGAHPLEPQGDEGRPAKAEQDGAGVPAPLSIQDMQIHQQALQGMCVAIGPHGAPPLLLPQGTPLPGEHLKKID